SGLANAILRRVSESNAPPVEGLELPEWLETRLNVFWAPSVVAEFARASATEPARVGRHRSSDASGGNAVEGVRGAYILEPGPVDEGYHIQDSASIAVGNLVRAEPGMTVLDVAAAPGGKTSHLLDQVGPGGTVVASDIHARRVESSRSRAPGALWVVSDGRRPPFRPSSFDRILVDAPCTGLGTLRRRPEILYRVGLEDVERMAVVQRQILEATIPLLKDDGELIYSVCTVTPEETIGVVSGLGFSDPSGPGEPVDGGRLMAPHSTGSDGMFFARYRN
ncbi:MAG: RsmB/NOP family class I SAM-dependent RNA methyltransferase, partial [Acidimicrobiia bacterium]|nr:RsmB/NOP family class I SAM-dependent RNA methyltransferase [Acidimicrobiia bacterium]